MPVFNLSKFNLILFDTQLYKSCVNVSLENLNAVLANPVTPGRTKRIVRSILAELPPPEYTTDQFLQHLVKKKATYQDVAELIPDADERALFTLAARKIK